MTDSLQPPHTPVLAVPVPDPDLRLRRVRDLFELVLCSSVPTQFVIGVLLVAFGFQATTGTGQFDLGFVVVLSLADTAVLVVLMVALTLRRGESPLALWVGGRPPLREAALGLWLVPAVFLAVVALLGILRAAAPWLHNVPANPLEQLAAGGPGNAALFALVAIFAGGVREELQRAFLLRRFAYLGGPWTGVVILSAAFGLGHWVQGMDAVVTTGALGAFWAVLYLRRGSSIAAIVSHAGFNALEVLRVALTGT